MISRTIGLYYCLMCLSQYNMHMHMKQWKLWGKTNATITSLSAWITLIFKGRLVVTLLKPFSLLADHSLATCGVTRRLLVIQIIQPMPSSTSWRFSYHWCWRDQWLRAETLHRWALWKSTTSCLFLSWKQMKWLGWRTPAARIMGPDCVGTVFHDLPYEP